MILNTININAECNAPQKKNLLRDKNTTLITIQRGTNKEEN